MEFPRLDTCPHIYVCALQLHWNLVIPDTFIASEYGFINEFSGYLNHLNLLYCQSMFKCAAYTQIITNYGIFVFQHTWSHDQFINI